MRVQKCGFMVEAIKHYKFGQCHNGYWKNKENHKSYVHDLGVYLGYKKSEDWYQITKQQISDFHGSGLLNNYYNGSPSKFPNSFDYKSLLFLKQSEVNCFSKSLVKNRIAKPTNL